MRQVAVKDLKPIHSRAHGSLRPGLSKLSDAELLDAVCSPARGDFLTENSRTGVLVDGNGRAHELQRRMIQLGGGITPDTLVPVDDYTSDLSMFPDLD